MGRPKKTQEASKEVVNVSNRRLAWGGAMPKPTGNQELATNQFVNAVSRIYGVPSLGVNAMGDKPYLNKDGRLFLLHDFRKGKEGIKAIRTEFLQMSKTPDEASICKVTLVFKDGHEIEGIGEASKDNVKLDAVKKTLNMMAETRAMNRAIWKEIAGDAWDRVSKNIDKSKMSEQEKEKIIEAGRVSFEEVDQPNVNTEPPVPSSKSDLESNLRIKIESCSDTAMLIDIDQKLQKSDLYSDKFKKDMKALISSKVDNLG